MSKQSKAGMFLLGGILGAAAGLLFAPKKGVELRENLFEKTMDILTDSQGVKEDICSWISNFRHDEDIERPEEEIIISKDFTYKEEPQVDINLDINKETN